MEDLASYILDIVENSIRANSSLINIMIKEDTINNILELIIEDNGCGMDHDQLNSVLDPFYTTKCHRRVGLGYPLYYDLSRECNGEFFIDSKEGVGTISILKLPLDHIDLPILGNIGITIMLLINQNINIDYMIEYIYNNNKYLFNTIEYKLLLEDIDINDPNVLIYIRDIINQNIQNLKEV